MKKFIAAIFILAAAATCVRLGFWQLSRLEERRRFNDVVRVRAAMPTVELESLTFDDMIGFRTVEVTGDFDFGRQIVEVGRTLGGVPGVYLLTPLVLDSGRAVLVARGWAASPDARRIELERYGEAVHARLQGIILQPASDELVPSDWPIVVRRADPLALQSRFPYELLPIVVRRATLPSDLERADFKSVPPPQLTDGPHLSYAVQWFLFAVVALGGGVAAGARARRPHRVLPDAIDIPPQKTHRRS